MPSGSSRRGRNAARRKSAPSARKPARLLRRVDIFQTARRQKAAVIAEDYVELIDELIREQGEARSVDLAKRLGVSHVTVTKTVQRLHRDGLVRVQPYRSIFLTARGKRLAAACRKRHELIVEFLMALGVLRRTAQRDAEGIEHHVSKQTLRAMRDFLRRRNPRAI